jgi:hypothetical protein
MSDKIDAGKIIAEQRWRQDDIRAQYVTLLGRIDNAPDEVARLDALGDLQSFKDELRFGFFLAFRLTTKDYADTLRELLHDVVGNDFQSQRKRHVQAHADSLTPEQRRNARRRYDDFRADHLAEIKFQLSELAEHDPEFLRHLVDRTYAPTVAEAIRAVMAGEVSLV